MGKRRNREFRRPASSTPPPPQWVELPRDLTANILLRLDVLDILDTAQFVCKTWRSVSLDPVMWRVIDLELGSYMDPEDWEDDFSNDIYRVYLHVVERSQGQLMDINIEYFGDDDLLYLISTLSSKLRRLRIARCGDITGKALCEAVKKFPELEELDLFFMSSIFAGEIEAIGSSCPKLKSFTFNEQGFTHPIKNDQLAFAVSKSMPNLCHLRLFGNGMTNKGLQAILDGCPHLESLDLRQCFNVVLEGDPGNRCSTQINNLRRPSDSTADYEGNPYVINNSSDSECDGDE